MSPLYGSAVAAAALLAAQTAGAQSFDDKDDLDALWPRRTSADLPWTGAPDDPALRLSEAAGLDRRVLRSSDGLAVWSRTGTLTVRSDGSFERFSVARGAPLLGAPGSRPRDSDRYDIRYTRGLPSAVLGDERLALEVTPHAGVGLTSAGGSAEAGATVRLGERLGRGLSALGVTDGDEFGDRPRWYLFAAANRRAVGYNFARNGQGYTAMGLSTDEGAFVGDAQAGVAWRRGDLQASFGYVRRTVKAGRDVPGLRQKRSEDAVAFQLSIRPDW